MSAFDLSRLRRLLTSVGQEGDAASMAGSLHAKMESIFAKPGGYFEVASMTSTIADASVTAGAGTWSGGDPSVGFGSWVQMLAAAPFALAVTEIAYYNSTGYTVKFQIGYGGAGSEVVAGETDWSPAYSIFSTVKPLIVPALIPNGSRIAVRASAEAGGGAFDGVNVSYVPQ